MTYMSYSPLSHLPDPVTQSEFYQDVPAKRLIAWVIDTVFILALVVPTVVLTAFVGLFFLPLLFLMVGFVYRLATITGGSGTWGMRMMSIELRDAYGKRLDFTQALLHTLGYTVSMSFPLVQLVSVVFMATSERRQGLTDMVLGTAMVNRRV